MNRRFLKLFRWFDFKRLAVFFARPVKAVYNWILKLRHYRDEQRQLRYLSQSVFLEEAKIPDTFRIPIIAFCILIIIFFISSLLIRVDSVYKVKGTIVSNYSDYPIKVHENCILSNIFISRGQLVEVGDELIRLDCALDSIKSNESLLRNKILEEVYKAFIEERPPQLDDFIWYNNDFIPEYQKIYDKLLSDYTNKISHSVDQCHNLSQGLNELQKKRTRTMQEMDKEKRKILNNRIEEISLELNRINEMITDQDNNLNICHSRLNQLKKKEKSDIKQRLTEIQSLPEMHGSNLDESFRIRSVVRGIVKEIHKNVIGSIIKKGSEILTIKPIAQDAVIEVKIDVARADKIKLDDYADIFINASDKSYRLQGKVQFISKDTYFDDNGMEHKTGKVRITQGALNEQEKAPPYNMGKSQTDNNPILGELNLVPGREVVISFATGELSLLEYLLTPFEYTSK
jgi:hypothetical protein